jgi:iron complex outermembrane recepter protein
MSVRSPNFTLASAIAFALASAPAAFGQDGGLEEITITAQKREENLQNVPIAVSAFTGEQLQARGITNLGDLGSLAPNVQISTATGNTTGMQISIRGGVQINPALYWDPTVGVYVDGVYVAKNLGSVFDVMDLERIEVLRGPQGTLYGRNTLAGAVNFVTRAPSGEFGGTASVNAGNYDYRQARASLDLPAVGILKTSIGARYEERGGYPKTTAGSSVRELNTRDQKGVRFAADLDFTDTFQASYRFDWTDVDQTPLHGYLVRADLPFLADFVTRERPDRVGVDAPTFELSRTAGHALTLTWDATDAVQLRSITGFRNLNWSDQLDLDGTPVPVAQSARYSTFENLSQELQVVGATERANYVGGIYYYEDDGFTNNPQTFFFGTFNFDSSYGYATEAYAAYAQVDFLLTDAWTITGGLRYTRERKSIDRALAVNFAPGTPFIPLIPQGTRASQTFSDTTPLLTIAYRINENLNAYVKYAEGFKSGGFNGEFGDVGFTPEVIGNNILETQTPFRPETQQSVELGVKSTLANGRLQLNAAVFQNNTDDLQLSIFQATGAASSVIRNAGEATTRGFELEAQWRPVDALRLQASYGYLDAKYDEFIDAGVNVANNRAFVHAPENTFNFVVDGRIAQTPWGRLGILADYAYQDEMYLYPFQLSGAGQPGHNPGAAVAGDTKLRPIGLLNGRLSLSQIPAGNGTAEIALWGRNLTDEKRIANAIDFGPGFGSLTPSYYVDPRMYGIEATVRW